MKNPFRKAFVYIDDAFAGILAETDSGYCFSYDEEYLKSASSSPVSLTLTLRQEPYVSTALFPFF